MTSQIHYKFKNAVSSSTLEFDGPYLYVHELKKKLADKLGLGADVSLVLEDAVNADKVFTDPNVVVPKNSAIIVKRVPIAVRERAPPLQHSSQLHHQKSRANGRLLPAARNTADDDDFGGDLFGTPKPSTSVTTPSDPKQGAGGAGKAEIETTEEEKVASLVSGADWQKQLDATSRAKGISGRKKQVMHGPPIGQPGPGYICHRCNQPGHWIQHCPTLSDPNFQSAKRYRPPVGIPKPALVEDPEGDYILDGKIYKLATSVVENPVQTVDPKAAEAEVPAEYKCFICNKIMTDAVMITCCYTSFCDKCVRDRLLETNACPSCHAEATTDQLCPNPAIRKAIENWQSKAEEDRDRGMEAGNTLVADNDDTAIAEANSDSNAVADIVAKTAVKKGTVIPAGLKVERPSPQKELDDEAKAKLDAQRIFESKLVKDGPVGADGANGKEGSKDPADLCEQDQLDDKKDREDEDNIKRTGKDRACDSNLNETQKNDQEIRDNQEHDLVIDKRLASVNTDQGVVKELNDINTNNNPQQIVDDPHASQENFAPNSQDFNDDKREVNNSETGNTENSAEMSKARKGTNHEKERTSSPLQGKDHKRADEAKAADSNSRDQHHPYPPLPKTSGPNAFRSYPSPAMGAPMPIPSFYLNRLWIGDMGMPVSHEEFSNIRAAIRKERSTYLQLDKSRKQARSPSASRSRSPDRNELDGRSSRERSRRRRRSNSRESEKEHHKQRSTSREPKRRHRESISRHNDDTKRSSRQASSNRDTSRRYREDKKRREDEDRLRDRERDRERDRRRPNDRDLMDNEFNKRRRHSRHDRLQNLSRSRSNSPVGQNNKNSIERPQRRGIFHDKSRERHDRPREQDGEPPRDKERREFATQPAASCPDAPAKELSTHRESVVSNRHKKKEGFPEDEEKSSHGKQQDPGNRGKANQEGPLDTNKANRKTRREREKTREDDSRERKRSRKERDRKEKKYRREKSESGIKERSKEAHEENNSERQGSRGSAETPAYRSSREAAGSPLEKSNNSNQRKSVVAPTRDEDIAIRGDLSNSLDSHKSNKSIICLSRIRHNQESKELSAEEEILKQRAARFEGRALSQDTPRVDARTQATKSVSSRNSVSVSTRPASQEEPVNDLRTMIQTSGSQGMKKRRKLKR